ncbi:MAG: glycosyltransferase family 2 protein [Prevotella sp.]|nr:glycosyltransferase family 2 protein [Prevotella sp.]MBR6189183.1 glycosyltransferase family 2 protein [Prevotella sp.]
MTADSQKSKITVLMSTYNGEKYLTEQIESILNQRNVDVNILVRDDGSIDGTTAILDNYSARSLLTWYQGANVGPARSFLDLLRKAPESEYYAFSDQDDYWNSEKMASASSKLKAMGDAPTLYIGQTQPADEQLRPLPIVAQQPLLTFGEALVHPYASGCTMVLNHALREVIVAHAPHNLYMHDWWVVLVATAIGARIAFDPEPHMAYRQHAANVIGEGESLVAEWKRRIHRFLNEQANTRSQMAAELKKACYELMPAENRRLLDLFLAGKHSASKRIRLCTSSDFRCNVKKTNSFFKIALVLNTY